MKTLKPLLLAAAIALPGAAVAQSFPERQVTIVIPFSPGGSNDTLGRYLAEQLGEVWGETVIVDNRPGAGAMVGASYVARAEPDGHTILFVSGTLTTTAATRRNLPVDPMEDLQPVAMGAVGQMAIVTGSRVPMTTVEDVLREARSQTLFYGTTGVGSITHFGAELLSSVADIQMEPVHYSGGTDALVDLAGGRIDLYVGTVTQVMSSIQSGMATPVAVISASRSSALPDVPTIGEAGVPGAEADVWWGVFTADGTPPEVVQALNDAINGLMSRPAAAEFLAPFGAQPSPMSVEDFEAWVQGEFDNWSRLAELNNMVMD